MIDLNVTNLEEIRAQAAPQVIEIPGFRPGATIRVAVRLVDLTPHLLEAGIGNPLLAAAREKAGEKPEASIDFGRLAPVLEAVAKEALAEPTYEQIYAVAPLTLQQKLAILNHVMGGIAEMRSFRGEQGV